MTDKQPNPSPRIYLAKRHRAWWHSLVRYERSRIVNEALDLYRKQHEKTDTRPHTNPDDPPSAS